MKKLIVDDEALARKLLTEYAKQVVDLKVVATYVNALDAQ